MKNKAFSAKEADKHQMGTVTATWKVTQKVTQKYAKQATAGKKVDAEVTESPVKQCKVKN